MPIEETSFLIFQIVTIAFVIKAFFILFLIFYIVFAFILWRQIQLMGRTLPTPAVPFLKFVAIIHIGISAALLFAVIGTF